MEKTSVVELDEIRRQLDHCRSLVEADQLSQEAGAIADAHRELLDYWLRRYNERRAELA